MKSMLKFMSLAFIVLTVAFASCSKDDNPVDNDLFIGTYTGKTGYNGDTPDDGKVRVTKVGNKYRFDFVDNGDIPAITDIVIDKGEETLITITPDGYTGFIKIDANNLDITLSKDGNSWFADCSR